MSSKPLHIFPWLLWSSCAVAEPFALPELASPTTDEVALATQRETQWAQMAKRLGENKLTQLSSQQLRTRTEDYAVGQAVERLQQQAHELLSLLGIAQLSLAATSKGDFAGSQGQLLSPWWDNPGLLTYSQGNFLLKTGSSLINLGLGQRWSRGDWLLGYNAVWDNDIEAHYRRASMGSEMWGDYLRLSANYYVPLSTTAQSTTGNRPARGYDLTTQCYLPFYRQLSASLRYEHYSRYQPQPSRMQLSLSYTPIPLLALKTHRSGTGSDTQRKLELTISYRLGVPLMKQISPAYVAAAKSLRGSRYDVIERNARPVLYK